MTSPTVTTCLVLLSAAICHAQVEGLLQTRLASEGAPELAADAIRFGDPMVGAAIFRQPEMNCATCHLPHQHRRLGPDLAEKRDITAEQLVESLLFPSKQIRQGYETTLLLTTDGDSVSGILLKEDDDEVVLDQIEQPEKPLRVPRTAIEDRRTSDKSTMPDGLVNQLADRQQFLNLICYLHEIAGGGKARDHELSPAESLFALPPLPDYESDINHRRYVSTFDDQAFERGQEIYRLRCESCHGTVAHPGSLPTSLRFAEGKFKHGNDPHTLYRTLTHGYGMMNPQRWMVPRQKYDVIHFIREHFVRDHNPDQYFEIDSPYLESLPKGSSMGPEPVKHTPWTAMDYGPSLNNTIEVSSDRSNIAQKGIAIRLDAGPGGVESGNRWILYDHDLMRVAAVWSGQFIDYNGIHFNGVHGKHPRIAGQKVYENPLLPGWGKPDTASFEDLRIEGRDGQRYGPLPKDWLRYKGMYRFGNRTILSYQVGTVEFLESPSLTFSGDQAVVSRHFEMGPRPGDLVLQVAHINRRPDRQLASQKMVVFNTAENESTNPTVPESTSFANHRFLQSRKRIPANLFDRDFCILAEIKTNRDGTIVAQTLDQPDWMPNGKTFFIRNGRLHFDIGWVSVVASNQKVDTGKWIQVAMNWDAESGQVSFFADGHYEPAGRIRAKKKLRRSVLRIGFTNDNFPEPSHQPGHIRGIRVFDRCLTPDELANAETLDEKPVIAWSATIPADESVFSWRGTQRKTPTVVAGNLIVHTSLNPEQFEWMHDGAGNLRLRIRKGKDPLRFSVSCASSSEPFDLSQGFADPLTRACRRMPSRN